jgi:prenylcysteine oxidase/farnesylcysteine lyase
LSPYRQNKAVNALLTKFKHLYDSAWLAQRGTVSSIEEFAATLELGAELTSRTGLDWAKNEVGVNDRWASEIIEGSTRVNVSFSRPTTAHTAVCQRS